MNTFKLQDLLQNQNEENKLVFFSISLCLDQLRNGSIFKSDPKAKNKFVEPQHACGATSGSSLEDPKAKDKFVAVQPSPGRISRSYNVILNFFRDFLERKVPIYAKNRYFPIILSHERLDFVVAATVADEILQAFQKAHEATFDDFKSALPAKIAMIFFYQKYPLYAVIDAAGNMIHALNPGEFDFMLLDSSAQRFAFFRQERTHHILPVANRYQIEADVPRFQRLWEIIAKLPKSQISAIEELLVDKMLCWSEETCRKDCLETGQVPRDTPQASPEEKTRKDKDKDEGENDYRKTFRSLCNMILFNPNALQKSQLSRKQQKEVINAAADGTLLDVIELFIHLENKK